MWRKKRENELEKMSEISHHAEPLEGAGDPQEDFGEFIVVIDRQRGVYQNRGQKHSYKRRGDGVLQLMKELRRESEWRKNSKQKLTAHKHTFTVQTHTHSQT